MRKYGHSMAQGGVCESCKGTCKYAHNYAEGGSTSEYDKAGQAISQTISPEKAKAMKSWFGPPQAQGADIDHKADGGEVRGINKHANEHEFQPVNRGEKEMIGESEAGSHLRN